VGYWEGRYNVVLSAFSGSSTQIEAEAGVLSGGAGVGSSNTGFTGSGYVDYPGTTGDNVYTEVSFNNPTATNNATISIRYAMGRAGNRPLNLSINGGTPIKVDFPSTGGWTTPMSICQRVILRFDCLPLQVAKEEILIDLL